MYGSVSDEILNMGSILTTHATHTMAKEVIRRLHACTLGREKKEREENERHVPRRGRENEEREES